MGSTHEVEKLLSSIFSSIVTFDFDLILGSFLAFWAPNGLILGLGESSNAVSGSTYVVQQLSFSVIASILTDLLFGHFILFWALVGYFFGVRLGFKNYSGSPHID